MPVFVDEHPLTEVEPEALGRMITAAQRCTVDGYGVRPLDHFFDGRGRVHCVVEAPDAAAVQRNHASMGLGNSPLRQLTGLHVRRRLSVEDRAAIRAFLSRQPRDSPPQ
jgi:Protein of unknown function (DUF4242)